MLRWFSVDMFLTKASNYLLKKRQTYRDNFKKLSLLGSGWLLSQHNHVYEEFNFFFQFDFFSLKFAVTEIVCNSSITEIKIYYLKMYKILTHRERERGKLDAWSSNRHNLMQCRKKGMFERWNRKLACYVTDKHMRCEKDKPPIK